MIKFFRRIRLQLLSENKSVLPAGRLSKYLIYAIGEIVLVVIGILIALQINNWNERNKERATGFEYLQRIQSDLKKDTTHLNKKGSEARNIQQSFELYIRSIQLKVSSTAEFKELTASVFWESQNLILEDKTYSEITNTGKFIYIENDSLRDKIMDYYRRYYSIDEHISEMNQTGITMFANSYKEIIKYYPVFESLFSEDSMLHDTKWKFINDSGSQEYKELESAALFYYYKHSVFEKYYSELKSHGTTLLTQIDSEISQMINE